MKKLTDKEKAELSRAVRNFNAKVKRLEQKGYNINTVKIKDIKNEIFTAQDVKREVNKLKRFSRRGVEEMSKIDGITKYELKEFQITLRTQKAKITRQINNLLNIPFSAGGIPTGYSIANIKPLTVQDLTAKYEHLTKLQEKIKESKKSEKPIKDYKIREDIKKEEIRALKSSQYNKALTYKENYLFEFTENYKNEPEFLEIWNYLQDLSPFAFYDLIQQDDFLQDFINFYETTIYNSTNGFNRFKDTLAFILNRQF